MFKDYQLLVDHQTLVNNNEDLLEYFRYALLEYFERTITPSKNQMLSKKEYIALKETPTSTNNVFLLQASIKEKGYIINHAIICECLMQPRWSYSSKELLIWQETHLVHCIYNLLLTKSRWYVICRLLFLLCKINPPGLVLCSQTAFYHWCVGGKKGSSKQSMALVSQASEQKTSTTVDCKKSWRFVIVIMMS